ncbi:helix-turn-helix domain-containing protein [Caulobacter sp. 17J80-11]|uniref:AraC family transcriptional regulator n=1 Tax=Caulobacter sp. 17J80-11 TaxID=2763502 RepID=UPI0016539F5B|nr:helix-turn-helix domain-containing protein [Caulobacter sp. 17J80-11]MBC6980216.1 AraC family transcriptional regulator [Caulobacter sp. 17J80-11]
MQDLDVILRVGGAGVLVAVALLLLSYAPRERLFRYFLPFALGLAGFLGVNTPDDALEASGLVLSVARVFSGNAVIFLWWFCLAVFDDDFRLGPVELGGGAAWFVLFLLDRGYLGSGLENVDLSWLLIGLGSAMLANLAWRILRGLEGDLVEGRRPARVVVPIAVAGLVLTDFAVDAFLGFSWMPHWFTLAQNAAILLIAVRLAHWLLRANPEVLTRRPAATASSPAPVAAPAPAATGPDARLLRRLHALTEVEQVHLDPELDFAGFVQRMDAPEPAVRRLINQQLGHRHFRSFLNAWRVAAAKRALLDPALADEKIASLAFDSGFASLASFNRAFKLQEGLSPSDFRARALASAADGNRVLRSDPAGI